MVAVDEILEDVAHDRAARSWRGGEPPSTRSLVGSASSALTARTPAPSREHATARESSRTRPRKAEDRSGQVVTAWVSERPAAIDATRSRSPSGQAAWTSRMRDPPLPTHVMPAGKRATAIPGTNATNTDPVSAVTIRSANRPAGAAPRPRKEQRPSHPPVGARAPAIAPRRETMRMRGAYVSPRQRSRAAPAASDAQPTPTASRGEQAHRRPPYARGDRAPAFLAADADRALSNAGGSTPVHSSWSPQPVAQEDRLVGLCRARLGTTAVISVTWRRTRPRRRVTHRRDRRGRRRRAPREHPAHDLFGDVLARHQRRVHERVQRVGRAVGVNRAKEAAPALIARVSSNASAPRTSPTTIRSGSHRQNELDEVAQSDLAGAVESGRTHLVVGAVRRAGTASSRTSSQLRTQCRRWHRPRATAAASVVLPAPGSPRSATRLRSCTCAHRKRRPAESRVAPRRTVERYVAHRVTPDVAERYRPPAGWPPSAGPSRRAPAPAPSDVSRSVDDP